MSEKEILESILSKVTSFDTRFDGIEGRLTAIEGRLTNIEADLDKIEAWTGYRVDHTLPAKKKKATA